MCKCATGNSQVMETKKCSLVVSGEKEFLNEHTVNNVYLLCPLLCQLSGSFIQPLKLSERAETH